MSLNQSSVDPYVQRWVAGTNGNLYKPVINRLTRYPIPRWPGPPAAQPGSRMLDMGCGWGRWMVSAARAGYCPVGIDIKADAAKAAKRVLKIHGFESETMAGDLSKLPVPDDHFDCVFSYSVLQHLPKANAIRCLHETRRVLKPNGQCLIELPLRPGLTNWRHPQCESADPDCWNVRYYGWEEIVNLFSGIFDDVRISVDCVLGIGVKVEDLDVLPLRYRPIPIFSEVFRKLCRAFPDLTRVSDSVYVQARKPNVRPKVEDPAWT